MRNLIKFFYLSSTQRRLLMEAAFFITIIRLGLWISSFRTLRRLLARLSRSSFPCSDQEFPNRVNWAIGVISRRLPGTQNCLVQALSAQVLLLRRGFPARLIIGVQKGGEKPFRAHAWVESQNKIVLGGRTLTDFVPLPALDLE